VSDYDALLTAVTLTVTLGGAITAILAVRGHLTIALRRRPQPRKPAAPGES